VAPGAKPPSTDELLRRLDATPELKGRPKPFEVSAALGKLYYSRGRWSDAAEAFRQAWETAAPVRTLFAAERARTQGALPPADTVGCRLSADAAVAALTTRAKEAAARGEHGTAAACALEALGPALEAGALLGHSLALSGDGKAALAAYGRVLEVQPRQPDALYGHASVTFDVRGDDLTALRGARKELETFLAVAPSAPQAPSARALLPRLEAVIAAGGATRFAAGREKARAQGTVAAAAPPAASPPRPPPGVAAPAPGGAPPMAAGPGVPPPLSRETVEAIQATPRTPEFEANLARLLEEGEAKLAADRYQEALNDYRQVMPYRPEDGRLRAGMAWALVGLQRQPMADNIWRVAVESDPAAVDALGDRLLAKGNRAGAKALWTRLLGTAPGYPARTKVQEKLAR
jgi:tetratricopeptide (TPR) repeat protein